MDRIKSQGNKLDSSGFAFIWRNYNDGKLSSLCPYIITTMVVKPCISNSILPHKPQVRFDSSWDEYISEDECDSWYGNALYDISSNILDYAVNAGATFECDYNWKFHRENMLRLSNGDLTGFVAWGFVDELYSDFYCNQNNHLYSYNDPRLGLSFLNKLCSKS